MNKRFTYIERVTLTGKIEERDKARAYIEKNDFRVVWSGPMPIGGHRFDTTRFKIIAEREIEKP